MKNHKVFYEVGNNRYSTIVADNDLFLGTESFIPVGEKKLFRKQKELTQSFKLLEISAPVLKLFLLIADAKELDISKESTDIKKYEVVTGKRYRDAILDDYKVAEEEMVSFTNEHFDKLISDIEETFKSDENSIVDENDNVKEKYIRELEKARKLELEAIKNSIKAQKDVMDREHSGCMIVKNLIREGNNHLYTTTPTTYSEMTYLFKQDSFGTVIINRVLVVKNIAKSMETFVFDKKLIDKFLEEIKEEEK